MSDSGAPAAAPTTTSDGVPLTLVPADPADFVAGNPLYVRGREATCVRFDYPHVYWRWSDAAARAEAESTGREPVEKHRSYQATPGIFQVEAAKKRREREDNAATQQMDDTSDEDEGEVPRQHQQLSMNTPSEDGAGASAAAAGASAGGASGEAAAPADPVEGPRASLMSMFSRRPEKSIFTHVTDSAEEVIHASMPQSVNIESSARSTFRVLNKVTSITLLGCEDVTLEFLAVISAVELIRCQRCTIRCTSAAPTFTVDQSTACQIQFPGWQPRVMVVSTASSGTQLLAVPGGTPPPSAGGEAEEKEAPAALEAEVAYAVEEPEHGPQVQPSPPPTPSEPVEEAAAASSQATKQLRTVWANGAFTTEVLARQGAIGYFSNNDARPASSS